MPAPWSAGSIGAERAGDPIAVLPVLFHLLWRQRLAVDLEVLLGASSPVWPGTEARVQP